MTTETDPRFDEYAWMPRTYPAVKALLDMHVLERCADAAPGSYFDWWALGLGHFTNEWITKDMARAICRDLRDRGLLRFERGLFNEDGEVAGSGYRITDKGREYLKSMNGGPEQSDA